MKDDKVICIEINGGVVVGVHGLPKGYTYDVVDSNLDPCDLCYEGNCPHSCHSKWMDR